MYISAVLKLDNYDPRVSEMTQKLAKLGNVALGMSLELIESALGSICLTASEEQIKIFDKVCIVSEGRVDFCQYLKRTTEDFVLSLLNQSRSPVLVLDFEKELIAIATTDKFPLYYLKQDDKVIISHTLRALTDAKDRSLDGMIEYFAYGYTSKLTKEVQRLESGELLIFKGGRISVKPLNVSFATRFDLAAATKQSGPILFNDLVDRGIFNYSPRDRRVAANILPSIDHKTSKVTALLPRAKKAMSVPNCSVDSFKKYVSSLDFPLFSYNSYVRYMNASGGELLFDNIQVLWRGISDECSCPTKYMRDYFAFDDVPETHARLAHSYGEIHPEAIMRMINPDHIAKGNYFGVYSRFYDKAFAEFGSHERVFLKAFKEIGYKRDLGFYDSLSRSIPLQLPIDADEIFEDPHLSFCLVNKGFRRLLQYSYPDGEKMHHESFYRNHEMLAYATELFRATDFFEPAEMDRIISDVALGFAKNLRGRKIAVARGQRFKQLFAAMVYAEWYLQILAK